MPQKEHIFNGQDGEGVGIKPHEEQLKELMILILEEKMITANKYLQTFNNEAG